MLLLLSVLACKGGDVNIGSGELALRFEGAGCVNVPIDDRANAPNLTVEFMMRGESDHSLGVMPFLISDTVRALLLLLFPPISLWVLKFMT